MDAGTIFAIGITTLMAIGGIVAAAIAIVSLRRVVAQQTQKLSELATMKPYWIVEKREGRIETVIKLSDRIEQLEQSQGKFVQIDDSTAALDKQWGATHPSVIPPLGGDDVDDIGERRL